MKRELAFKMWQAATEGDRPDELPKLRGADAARTRQGLPALRLLQEPLLPEGERGWRARAGRALDAVVSGLRCSADSRGPERLPHPVLRPLPRPTRLDGFFRRADAGPARPRGARGNNAQSAGSQGPGAAHGLPAMPPADGYALLRG